jgi:hypothetical protein
MIQSVFVFPVSFIRRGEGFCVPRFLHKKGGRYRFCYFMTSALMSESHICVIMLSTYILAYRMDIRGLFKFTEF